MFQCLNNKGEIMIIIFYTPFEKSKQDLLQKEIYDTVKRRPAMVSDFNELCSVIEQNTSGDVLIVFFISSIEELEFLNDNNGLLFNRRFIFILLNGSDEMVSKGLSLYPRFIAHMSQDFKEIAAVVKRIINTSS